MLSEQQHGLGTQFLVDGLKEQLREAIRKSGRSLHGLSRVSGVGVDRLSRFVRGQRGLNLDAVEKLCRVLKLRLVRDESSR